MGTHARDAALLESVVTALYGRNWKVPNAKALGVTWQALNTWWAQRNGWPPDLDARLTAAARAERGAARQRAAEIAAAIGELEAGK